MKLKLLMSLSAFFLIGSLAQATPICYSDKDLADLDFTIHPPTQFSQLSEKVLQAYEENRPHFVDDTDGVVHSRVARKMLKVVSLDDLRTSRDEMYGDLLIVTDLEGNLAELRWYERGRRHVVYTRSQTPCATAMIPLAVNALF